MSYCQFENTVKDLRQVLDTLQNCSSITDLLDQLSVYEQAALRDLPYVCKDILDICNRYRDQFDQYRVELSAKLATESRDNGYKYYRVHE